MHEYDYDDAIRACVIWDALWKLQVESEENAPFLLEFLATFADSLPSERECEDSSAL